jgi:hypothetical protein
MKEKSKLQKQNPLSLKGRIEQQHKLKIALKELEHRLIDQTLFYNHTLLTELEELLKNGRVELLNR